VARTGTGTAFISKIDPRKALMKADRRKERRELKYLIKREPLLTLPIRFRIGSKN